MKKEIKIWTLDTETRGMFGDIFRIGCYDGEEYNSGYSFMDVSELFNNDYENHVFVHYLDFDLSKMAPELFKQGSIDFSKSVIINGNAVTINTQTIIFHDSYRLLGDSLDKLCKSFHIEHKKMNLDKELEKHGFKDKEEYFSKIDPDDEVLNEYLKLDCVSLYELLEKLMEIALIDEETLIKCPTTPSLAMKVFSTRFKDDYEKAISTNYYGKWGEFLESYVRAGYYGGRTEVFTPYLESFFHFDINSLYPYVMKSFPYPVGNPEYFEDKNAKRTYDFWKRRKIGGGFLRVDIYVPEMFIPPLPYRGMNKLLFPVGNLSGVWTFEEIRKAEELGCQIQKIYSCVYFRKMEYIFKEYIEVFEEIKVNGEGALREFAKKMLNTLYGKFGMRRDRSTFLNIEDYEELSEEEKEEIPAIFHRYTRFIKEVVFVETTKKSRAAYIQPHLSAYVTSYARLVLLEGLLKQDEVGTVAYCDTDSIAASAMLPDDMIDSKEFGKWKLEGTGEGIFLQPKFYAEKLDEVDEEGNRVINIKAKGVPHSIIEKELTFEWYEYLLSELKKGELDEVEVYSNYKARQKFITMLKNNQGMETPTFLSKTINLKAEQKRVMLYEENTSLPHNIKEFGGIPDRYRKKEKRKEFDFDVNFIEEDIKEYGKIKYLKEESPYFLLYTTLPKKRIDKYFGKKGISLTDFCDKTGWRPEDLLYEMGVDL